MNHITERNEARILAKQHGLNPETARSQLRRAKQAGMTWEEFVNRPGTECPICHRVQPLVLDSIRHVMVCRRCRNGLGSVSTPELALAFFDYLEQNPIVTP